MASIRKRGSSWRVEIYKDGVRESGTFPTKQQAAAWAMHREAELVGKRLPEHTLRDALYRYAREESPKHKGERWEVLRCHALARLPLAEKRLQAITNADMAERRDHRGKTMAVNTVRREMALLNTVFDVAIREWGWIRVNPMKGVTKPTPPPGRRRRITQDEITRATLALGYEGGEPANVSQRVAMAFLFALETAMRSSEITGLTWDRVREKSVVLPETKNGDRREVALSRAARAILANLPRVDGPVFQLDPAQRDALWRKGRDRAELVNLHFHDSRAEAIWRLSKKLDVMELARMIGHRDIKSLMLYYNVSADELADRLD